MKERKMKLDQLRSALFNVDAIYIFGKLIINIINLKLETMITRYGIRTKLVLN